MFNVSMYGSLNAKLNLSDDYFAEFYIEKYNE